MTGLETPGGPTAETVRSLMPQLKADLARLVAIPSVSAPNYPEATRPALLEAYEDVVTLFRDAGVRILDPLELPDTAPVVMGEIPAPPGAPTVLLYSHYDVVPVGDEAKWESPPFEATERNGAIYGRGSADTKSNILMHVGALRAWEGRPPVGIKVVIEGMEEVGSAFSVFPPSRPELFAADAMVIGDMGSFRPGVPTLTVALRGMAMITVEVRTLAGPKHSGQFGGAAPDALLALLHAIATLHDEHGDVTVPGLRREEWTGDVVQRRGVPCAGRRSNRGSPSSGRAASGNGSGRARPSPSRESMSCPSTRRSTRSRPTPAPS